VIRTRRWLAAPIALALLVGACDTATVSPLPSVAPTPVPTAVDWHDAAQPVEARVEALLAEMTLDEKIGQMTQLENHSADPAAAKDLLLGSVLSGGGGAPPQNDADGWYAMVDAYQQAALSTRLGIPMLYGVDAVHGHNNVPGATIFPQQIGLGAAADQDLVERIGRATAAEMAATGIRWDFGPVVAVPQDVRWGRTYEGYSEDPILVADLASAFIRGMQGTDLTAPGSALATAKHYVGDGGTTFGSSTTPGYLIDQGVVTDLDEETFRAIHLTPYEAAVEAGARIVMASFSSTSAGKVHGDHHLITELLKGELGFTGFVVSDWGGIDQVDPDYETAVAKAITAGIDMAMVPYNGRRFQDAVRTGLERGDILGTRVDDAVRRILRVKFEMGLFDAPMPPSGHASDVGSDADRALAREAVATSLVLLETKRGVLPLERSDGSVLLAGRGADDIGLQSGGWTITWQGSPGDITPGTTISEALAERLGDRLAIDAGGRFPAGTRAKTGIVVVAEPPYAEGVGDSATLELPAVDLATVARVRKLVDRLIVVVLSGRPVLLDEVLPSADAVIAAWLPGTEGAGVADVLFGDTPFRGTTPVAWPLTPDDAPRTGKEPCEGARFALGYGLDTEGRQLGDAEVCPVR
jgi:beta-glucosidase